MRVGYSFWGFMGDNKYELLKPVSTPDGNATYSWSVLWEMQRRGWKTYAMQQDRDRDGWEIHGSDNFAAFSRDKRAQTYKLTEQTNGTWLPELDVLLLEWRFPIPGRNCDSTDELHPVTGLPVYSYYFYDPTRHQPDFYRQLELLRHYGDAGTKIILWDLDHKLEAVHEQGWIVDAIFETSARPKRLTRDRVRVEPPILVPELRQFPTLLADPSQKLVYVGSRYERDDVIEEWVLPAARAYPGEVRFWGKWEDQPGKPLWKDIVYSGRITTRDFRRAYQNAVACPLLAKRSYLETGFVTPRPWEALLFGTIPVGLGSHIGIGQYVLPGMIAGDGEDMIELVETLAGLPLKERDRLRQDNIDQLDFMDVRNFVDRIQAVRDNEGVRAAIEDQGIQQGERDVKE